MKMEQSMAAALAKPSGASRQRRTSGRRQVSHWLEGGPRSGRSQRITIMQHLSDQRRRRAVLSAPLLALLLALLCSLGGAARAQLAPEANATSAQTTTMAAIASTTNSATTTEPSSTLEQQTNASAAKPAELAPPEPAPSTQQQQQQPSKLKPVNFTLVDELFAATLDDDELVKRWRLMDQQFQDGIRSILKLIFPQIVAISQDAKVSGDCSGGILKWILSLRNLRSWAIKMLDATGKPTSGVFQGSLTMMGNHAQCLAVRAPDEDEIEITDQFEEYFRGQYCVVHLRPPLPQKSPFYHLNSTVDSLLRKQYKYYEKTLYDELAEIAIAFQFIDIRLDLCVPSTCSRADIQRVAELLGKKLEFRAKVLRCDIEARDSSASLAFQVANSEQAQLWLGVPVTIVSLTLFASALAALKHLERPQQQLTGLRKLICELTLKASCARLLSTPDFSARSAPPKLELVAQKPWPLYGLRNLFIIWFIIVQMTVQLKYQYLRESLVLRNMLLNYWPFQIIINTSMIFESLILITAFTHAFRGPSSCSIVRLLADLFCKYTRILPLMITTIVVTMLTPSLGNISPVWRNFVEDQAATCKSTGYINLLFLQNFIAYDKICIPHSWLLCVELQLVTITIPLVSLLNKALTSKYDDALELSDKNKTRQPKTLSDNIVHLLATKTGCFTVICILAGVCLNLYTVYTSKLPPSWFNTFPDADHKSYYFGSYLAKTWTHISVFLVGLLGGQLCRSMLESRLRRDGSSDGVSDNPSQKYVDKLTPDVELLDTDCKASTTTASQSLTPSASVSTLVDGSPGSSRGLVISVPQTNSVSSIGQNQRCSKNQKQLSRGSAIYQLSAVICMLAIIFSTYTWSTQQLPSPLVSALFDSLSRLVWSLALVGLMTQLCLASPQTDNLTCFAQWLSCKNSIVMGRLSLLAYLWAPYIHTFVLAVQEQALFPSLILIFHVIVGNIVITYVICLLMSILIEQPVRSIVNQCLLARRK